MTRYHYFISFVGPNPDGSPGMGFGSHIFTIDDKIETCEHLRRIEAHIKADQKIKWITVLNFQLVKEETK